MLNAATSSDLSRGWGCCASRNWCRSASIAELPPSQRELRNVDYNIATNINHSSPNSVPVKCSILRTLFKATPGAGVVQSCVYTEFFVDHEEPLAALGVYKKQAGGWPLGELLDGHEYLAIVPVIKVPFVPRLGRCPHLVHFVYLVNVVLNSTPALYPVFFYRL